jgi:hypothetical protein
MDMTTGQDGRARWNCQIPTGKFDISDAGMIFYWTTVGNTATSVYLQPAIDNVRKLLEDSVAKEDAMLR